MSTHSVKIIEISEVRPHENADRLCIVPVGGWSCVVGKDQFRPGSRAIYIEPDYVVPLDRPEFAFLRKEGSDKVEHRLKAIRLRGMVSFGLLIPVPESLAGRATGDNVINDLGVRRYEPPVKSMPGGLDDGLPEADWPQVYSSKFDVEDLRKHEDIFQAGEPVIVTEKLHGASSRAVWKNGVFYMGSRTRWLKPDVKNHWVRAFEAAPQIAEWCKVHPETVLYGETYGPVQELKYGLREPAFAAFAALRNGEWMNLPELHSSWIEFGVPRAALIYSGPYNRDKIAELAEGDSLVPSAPKGHMMEGVVIVPVIERRDDRIGRVCLKLISNRYWLS
jgi:RNA ligase (TIGR02306 family)